jgi:hypothetical protein
MTVYRLEEKLNVKMDFLDPHGNLDFLARKKQIGHSKRKIELWMQIFALRGKAYLS